MSADPRLRSKAVPVPPPPPPEEVSEQIQVGLDGTSDSVTPPNDKESTDGGYKLKFCTVCASNNNRSMEAHLQLSSAQYPVISFGTGSLVRLPGPSITQPNVYAFNTTTYDAMYRELESKDARLYRANGILNMLDRNRHTKRYPERWQDWRVGAPRTSHKDDKGASGVEGGVVDVVITCEERCWDAVVDDLLSRGSPLNRPVHVFNVDIKDNHEEALVGGKAILDLATRLNDAANEERALKGPRGWDAGHGAARVGFDERVPDILGEWQEKWPGLPALWTLAWF
ncbi:transcription/RNA-processing factor Ssu72 [Phyllosticta citrichinensis]|uniref:RNA polymerase II subunit A C-terminal domain phosphatase SSU72 n=1 Tax=Phyllosticta citrichinensis TaxID=1130410 RepID=A0ABR1XSG0_9PEZI